MGVDIDGPAIAYARENHPSGNLQFVQGDSLCIPFPPDSFDVAVCNQVYEHVTDAHRLMAEIHRVLKPNGVCYFAANNRIRIMEPHYHLPFLSVLPRALSHLYIRVAGKARHYHEMHLCLWGLRRLVKDFHIVDYTRKVIEQPDRFHAEYLLRPQSMKAKAARVVARYFYWLCPSYIWLLVKNEPP